MFRRHCCWTHAPQSPPPGVPTFSVIPTISPCSPSALQPPPLVGIRPITCTNFFIVEVELLARTPGTMGKQKQVRKFGAVKRLLNPNDQRLYVTSVGLLFRKENKEKAVEQAKKEDQKKRHVELAASSMFFQHNSALGPPYRVLVDTNFINFALQNKIELIQGMMDCLYAKSTCLSTNSSYSLYH